MWQKWALALLGLVVVAVPFMGLSSAAMMWSLAVAGVAVIALSLWSLSTEPEVHATRSRYQHSS